MSTEKLAFLMGAKQYAKPLEDAAIRWGITQGRDKARWLAQLYVESNGFNNVSELTGYRAETLYKTFPGRNGLTSQIASDLVRAGPRAVFNFIYGGKWGRDNLGNIKPDDGWNFRGRSLIQTTGRDNYRATSMGMFGDERLLEEPDLLTVPEHAADASGWYWYNRRCNGIEDIRALTKKINPGLKHLDRRIAQTTRAYDLLDFLVSGSG